MWNILQTIALPAEGATQNVPKVVPQAHILVHLTTQLLRSMRTDTTHNDHYQVAFVWGSWYKSGYQTRGQNYSQVHFFSVCVEHSSLSVCLSLCLSVYLSGVSWPRKFVIYLSLCKVSFDSGSFVRFFFYCSFSFHIFSFAAWWHVDCFKAGFPDRPPIDQFYSLKKLKVCTGACAGACEEHVGDRKCLLVFRLSLPSYCPM